MFQQAVKDQRFKLNVSAVETSLRVKMPNLSDEIQLLFRNE